MLANHQLQHPRAKRRHPAEIKCLLVEMPALLIARGHLQLLERQDSRPEKFCLGHKHFFSVCKGSATEKGAAGAGSEAE